MDTMSAFIRGQANRGKPSMVFDWNRAAQIIKERGAKSASAGLEGDWEWTGGTILTDGKPTPHEDTYVFLASTWATPQLEVDGETIECYVMADQTPGWNSGTYWPDSALTILGLPLNGEGKP